MPDYEINGVRLSLPNGLATPAIAAKIADGSYESDEARAANRCVRPDFRVLELGAGIGYVSTLCAQRTAPENVLAVEANPELIPVIEGNLALNGVEGVSILHAAATGPVAEGAVAPFNISRGFTASSLDAKSGWQIDVPLVSVHDLLEAHRPHVVLMDVEGAEANMFSRKWDCPLRYCVMDLHPKKYPPAVIRMIVDFMSSMDMTYDPATSRGRILGFRRVWGMS